MRGHRFLLALGAVVVLGVVFPAGGGALRDVPLLLPAMTAATLFVSGLGLESGFARATSLRGLALGVGSSYLVAPLAAWTIARLLAPPDAAEARFFLEAMMLVATQAGTIASAPALVMLVGGDQALALAITLATNLTTAVVTPVLLRVSLGAEVAFPLGEMMSQVALVVLAPILAGQLVRRSFGERVRPWLPSLVRLSQVVILVFVYTGVCAAAAQASGGVAALARFFAAAVLLHLVVLGAAQAAATALGLPDGSRTAVAVCGSQKTLPNGIYLWDRFFPENPHGAIAIVVHHLFQLVFDTVLFSRLRGARPPIEPLEQAAGEA